MPNAALDFETYSEAGYVRDATSGEWKPAHSGAAGLKAVGAAVYAEHSSTRVLCAAYDLDDGQGPALWVPGMPPPTSLFAHIKTGGIVEAWNMPFENLIWKNVCVKKMGWPPLPLDQTRCAMARSFAHALPGALGKCAIALDAETKKDTAGAALIKALCVPNARPASSAQYHELYAYCLRDVGTQKGITDQIPELSDHEQAVWLLGQRVNARGVYVDGDGLDKCINAVNKISKTLTEELIILTNGEIIAGGQLAKMLCWLLKEHCVLPNLQAMTVESALARADLSPRARKLLELRRDLGSQSIKKVFALRARIRSDGRVGDLYQYHAARTGREAGRGPQPQNLPRPPKNYDTDAALLHLDSLKTVSHCLRGLFCAAPRHDLICSDYSAIEAVCLAELAGEKWRQNVFRTHGKIYEMSAKKITGREEDRKLGKIAELASGYGGWVGAWKQFGADKFMTDAEIERAVKKWREESPAIVAFWRGLEAAAKASIRRPGHVYPCREISFQQRAEVLYMRLPSGRELSYHSPRLAPSPHRTGTEITYSDHKKGSVGWARLSTYGGKLTENATQAAARDVWAGAMRRVDATQTYKIVLHTHDDIVTEVEEGGGSVKELENLMRPTEFWCADWPVKAAGGWRGKRYRK